MRVLFVCAGNTCRSPFAERLARQLALERGLAVQFGSAGEIARDGDGSPGDAVAAAREYGVDLTGHRSRRLGPALTDEAELVVSLHHVPDPIGRGPEAYRETYGQLREEVGALLERL